MRRCKLGDIADFKTGPFGTQFNPREYINEGIPMIATESIDNGILDMGSVKYVSPQTRDRLKAHIVEKDDIVFGRAGSVDRHLYIDDKYVGFLQGSNCIRMRKRESINMRYLSYYLQLESVKKQITNHSSGSVQSFLNTDKLGAIEIVLQDDSNKIANLLYSFDKKIALNNRVNATLEAMAKTLYDYWFVQFDFPDEKGRPYKTSGGKMVYNEELGREIPAGWEVGNLNVIAEYINGLACQRFRPAEDEDSLPVVKIREIHEGVQIDTERVSANIPDSNIIHDGDILFSWSAILEVHYWIGGKAGLNQHIFKVMPKDGFCREYLYYQLKEYVINFSKIAEARKTTMGHITQDHLELSRIAIPPRHVMSSFQKIVCPIHERMIKCKQENLRLAALRDWLLPMLMNGQVGFKGEAND